MPNSLDQLPPSRRAALNKTRNIILKTLLLAHDLGGKVSTVQAKLNGAHSMFLQECGVFRYQPKPDSRQPVSFEMMFDLESSLERVELYIDLRAKAQIEAYQQELKEKQRRRAPPRDGKSRGTAPPGATFHSCDDRHWTHNSTYTPPRSHSSLGGNSIACHI